MIVREMFSTILKQVASDNTKNLTVATQIDYHAIVMRNIAKAISEKNEDGLTELIKQLDSLGVVDLSQRGC
jgi:hypothetical protein